MDDQSSRESQKESQKIKSFKGLDQRYLPRWEVTNRVLYNIENDEDTRQGLSKDISCSGACIVTDEKLSPEQKVKLSIYLSDDVIIQVKGKIVWQKSSDNQNMVGIVFSDTSQKIQDTILKYAFEIKKEELVKHWFKGWNNKN